MIWAQSILWLSNYNPPFGFSPFPDWWVFYCLKLAYTKSRFINKAGDPFYRYRFKWLNLQTVEKEIVSIFLIMDFFMKLEINRIYQDDCTVGVLNYGEFRCFTLELPWLDNARSISCIPSGEYLCKKIVSPSLGNCIDVTGVDGRTYIRIHKGNYTSQIEGCILVGDSLKDINRDGVIDVTNSKSTLSALMTCTPDEFMMEIQ